MIYVITSRFRACGESLAFPALRALTEFPDGRCQKGKVIVYYVQFRENKKLVLSDPFLNIKEAVEWGQECGMIYLGDEITWEREDSNINLPKNENEFRIIYEGPLDET